MLSIGIFEMFEHFCVAAQNKCRALIEEEGEQRGGCKNLPLCDIQLKYVDGVSEPTGTVCPLGEILKYGEYASALGDDMSRFFA
jgi:hypothetical protein